MQNTTSSHTNEIINNESNELELRINEYRELSEKARFDKTYESDYQAAFRVPALFMFQKFNSFEQTFDKIIYHLDESYRKCDDEYIHGVISRSAEDLFHELIFVFQKRIDQIEVEKTKGFIVKIGEFVKSIFSNTQYLSDRSTAALALAPEIGKLTTSFLEYLYSSWELKREESFFYVQLANIYQKILNSKCFSNRYGLVKNTFCSNKLAVLRYVTQEKGVTSAIHLIQFDESQSDIRDSLRIILFTLLGISSMDKYDWKKKLVNNVLSKDDINWSNCDWEKCADFMVSTGKMTPDNNELRKDFLSQYDKFLQYLKTRKGRKSPNKFIEKKYPTVRAMELRILGDNERLQSYLRRIFFKRVLIYVIIIVSVFLFFYWASTLPPVETTTEKSNVVPLTQESTSVKKQEPQSLGDQKEDEGKVSQEADPSKTEKILPTEDRKTESTGQSVPEPIQELPTAN